MKNKRIGILYLATGRYICFWEEFYKTAQQFLFPDFEKTFFVFTDSEAIYDETNPNVKKYYYPKLKWPDAGLMKYDAFLKAEQDYADIDYLFYFNGNMKFVDTIGGEILPTEENENLAIAVWASYWHNRNNLEYPYNRDEKCWAYIPEGEGKYYFMAGLYGGKTPEFLEMCRELNTAIKIDMENGCSAHDESYANKYMLNRNPLLITPNYIMPDKWKIKGFTNNIKGIILKKHHYKYGGHAYLRGETDKKITPLKWWLNKVFGLHLT
ncbi:glycosyltransferase [bacterium]|nr:glycosyltransferase [bacterium]